jgi:hypothetical protein
MDGWPTTRALCKQHISNDLLAREFRDLRRVTLFPYRHFAPQFVEEVQEEDDVIQSLLRALGLGGGS